MTNKQILGYKKALKIAEEYVRVLRPCCVEIQIAGSLRRRKKEVGDIEIVAIPKFGKRSVNPGLYSLLGTTVEQKVNLLEHKLEQLHKQDRLFSYGKNGPKYKELIMHHTKIDLFIASEINFGVIMLLRTGSAEYSKGFVTFVRYGTTYFVKGGYLRKPSGEVVPVRSEEQLFQLVGLEYLDPTKRHTWRSPSW